jgi:hypothetical protein
MLCNIFQYVPYLYSKRLRDEETGKSTLEDKRYAIPITNKKIIWKGAGNKVKEENGALSIES